MAGNTKPIFVMSDTLSFGPLTAGTESAVQQLKAGAGGAITQGILRSIQYRQLTEAADTVTIKVYSDSSKTYLLASKAFLPAAVPGSAAAGAFEIPFSQSVYVTATSTAVADVTGSVTVSIQSANFS